MARLRYNGLTTTLGASLTNSATAVTFSAALTHSGGTAVPTISGGNYIPLVILDSTGKASEIVHLTAYTSGATTGTILRAQESTTGVSHASGDKVDHGLTVTDVVDFLVEQGDRIRSGERALDSNDYVKMQAYHDDSTGMVIWTQKVENDSTDINIDGSVLVKHGKDYAATPGYADTFQVYALAGSAGTIIGSNNFSELGAPPYSIPGDPTANGFIRFELGPSWPDSEVARLNNGGDFILGWVPVVTGCEYSQSGTTVTRTAGSTAFTANMVGSYLIRDGGAGDPESGVADRITGYTSATVVTVETSRTRAGAPGRVAVPATLVRSDGTVETYAGHTVKQRVGQTGPLLQVKNTAGTVLFGVDANGSLTGDFPDGGTTTGAGELLMQDGVTGPPMPIENEARSDWLYEG